MGWIADIIEEHMQENSYGKASHIEYWYDSHTRLWVVEVLDNRGYEVDYGSYINNLHQIAKSIVDITIRDYMREYDINDVRHLVGDKVIRHKKWNREG